MRESLDVWMFGSHVGVLERDAQTRALESWSFAYAPEVVAAGHPQQSMLSVTMPLSLHVYAGEQVSNWFGNLLPEEDARAIVTGRLRIDRHDDFALLRAIGGECAGAVSVGAAPGQALAGGELDLETALYLDGNEAAKAPIALVGTPKRLSLAGAQDKLAVVRQADGRLALPAAGEPSTHILKPDSYRFPGIRDMEAFALRLASALGLNTVRCELLEVMGRPALLLERYDRAATESGDTLRLHQEDFCQALGFPAWQKYEDQVGPTLQLCSQFIRQHALGVRSVRQFLSWVIFNTLIGNADAHAKNLAILYRQDGTASLTPMYDLVPTIFYPNSLVDSRSAMRVGSRIDIREVDARDWRDFAKAAGYSPRLVISEVRRMAELVIETIDAVGGGLVGEGAQEEPVLRCAGVIRHNTQQILARSQGSDS